MMISFFVVESSLQLFQYTPSRYAAEDKKWEIGVKKREILTVQCFVAE
jgi:hypothetical protein